MSEIFFKVRARFGIYGFEIWWVHGRWSRKGQFTPRPESPRQTPPKTQILLKIFSLLAVHPKSLTLQNAVHSYSMAGPDHFSGLTFENKRLHRELEPIYFF